MREALAEGNDTDSALLHFAGILTPEEAAVLRRSLEELAYEPDSGAR
jgi:hypothetical protein